MTITLDAAGLALIALSVLLALIGAALVARRRDPRPVGSWRDRLRLGAAIARYDLELELAGIGARRRRDLRAELRANLTDAAARVGAPAAVAALGPLRDLARATADDPPGPRWNQGLAAGLLGFASCVLAQFVLSTAVVDAAFAAGARHLQVDVTLVPGMSVAVDRSTGDGFGWGIDFGPLALIVAVLAFALIARPWRAVRRRARAHKIAQDA